MAKKPVKYSPELIDKLCLSIATSESGLHAICQEPGMPAFSTVFKWLADPNKQDFVDKYTRARRMQMDFMAEKLLEIADDGTNDYMTITKGDETYNVEDREVTNRSKLRVDTRKFLMSKIAPKVYGDKLDITSGDEPLKNFAPQIIIKPTE